MTRPNIIKIICHDIGKHLGCYGIKSLNTNSIDSLAKEGILFNNAFATSPGCSPSRAAIATGRYPHNTGVLGLAHAHFGWSLDTFIDEIGDHVIYLHVVDALGFDGEGIQIGEGDVNFTKLAKTLNSSCSNAPFIPEVWQGHKDDGAGFWDALVFLEEYL